MGAAAGQDPTPREGGGGDSMDPQMLYGSMDLVGMGGAGDFALGILFFSEKEYPTWVCSK